MKSLLKASLLSLALLLGACVTTPAPTVDANIANALAPTGVLRIGVYEGSPTSLVTHPKTGVQEGVALQLGIALSKQLGIPYKVVEFPRLSEVLIAMQTVDAKGSTRAAAVDFTFTNATPVRAKDVDFTAPLISLELGYLVPQASSIRSLADIDQTGVKVGVAQGSSSQAALAKAYAAATLFATPSLADAGRQLQAGTLSAFATNKAILFELKDSLPAGQFRILDARWGLEHLAIAVPKGRSVAAEFMAQFAQRVQQNGDLTRIIQGAGLRGTVSSTEGKTP